MYLKLSIIIIYCWIHVCLYKIAHTEKYSTFSQIVLNCCNLKSITFSCFCFFIRIFCTIICGTIHTLMTLLIKYTIIVLIYKNLGGSFHFSKLIKVLLIKIIILVIQYVFHLNMFFNVSML